MRLQLLETRTSAPMFDSPAWRADVARGIRAAIDATGRRPRYLVDAIARMRATLGPSELIEVAAPRGSSNPKLAKNPAVTLSFTGAPASVSGFNACPASTAGCRAVCVLSEACGHAAIERAAGLDTVIRARIRRMQALRAHPIAAGVAIAQAAARARRIADATGARAVARMNVGTDLPWEMIPDIAALFTRFRIAAYAYTKRPHAVRLATAGGGFANGTRLVYSWSEDVNENLASELLAAGGTVAVVFGGLGAGQYRRALPRTFAIGGRTWNVIDGDEIDDRTTDPAGVIVGLRGKGPLAVLDRAKLRENNAYGFAIAPDDPRIRP